MTAQTNRCTFLNHDEQRKIPNAEIKGPNKWGYYIVLRGGMSHIYLVNNQPSINDCTNGWHSTRQQAEAALNKFITPDPTLSEIKSQFAEAKKLIGKTVSNTHDSYKNTVEEVFLAVESSPKTSALVMAEIRNKGYCIALKCRQGTYPFSICKEYKGVQLSNQYTAELVDNNNYWKIGNSEFAVSFIRGIYNFLASHSAAKVIAYDVTFDLDMVKKLLES